GLSFLRGSRRLRRFVGHNLLRQLRRALPTHAVGAEEERGTHLDMRRTPPPTKKIVQKKLGRDGEGPKHGIGLDSRLLSPYSRRDSCNTEAWKRFPGAGVARCGYDAK